MKGAIMPICYKELKKCIMCHSHDLERVLQLTPTPIADNFKEIPSTKPDPVFPLDLFSCNCCGNTQLGVAVEPNLLFKNYSYQTKTSLGLVKHFENISEKLFQLMNQPVGKLVLDIGSNDGSMLRAFKRKGMRVLGVDPAVEIAALATKEGLETLPEYFSASIATQILNDYGLAQIITANNVFAHSAELDDMLLGISRLLAPDGVFEFEVNYIIDIFDQFLFDTIYHEHLCYHSVTSLERFFDRYDMVITEIERSRSKGGSIRCIVQKKESDPFISPSVNELKELEASCGFLEKKPFCALQTRLDASRAAFHDFVKERGLGEKTVYGFGASPTCTTLAYHFGINSLLSGLFDDNELKQGKFSPGLNLRVHSSARINDLKPDYILILAWRYAEPIIRNHKITAASVGSRIVVPCPELKVI
jgi:SAM-dependent methyltransferase